MAKFDVYRQVSDGCYLLDCQADMLSDLNTRFVVPLLDVTDAPKPAARLNPLLDVRGETLVMVTQFAAAVPCRELGAPIMSLIEEQDAIGRALDMLIAGY